MRTNHKLSLVAVIGLMLLAAPVAAQRIMLVKLDSLGVTMYDVADYVREFGPSTTVDSVILEGQRLFHPRLLPYAPGRLVSLNATDQWRLCFDLDQRAPYHPLGLTASFPDSAQGLICTLTIFPARFFLDPANSDCFKNSVLAHEGQHVIDILDGGLDVDATALGNLAVTLTIEEFLDQYEAEASAYLAQAQAAYEQGCSDSYQTSQAYEEGYFGWVKLRRYLLQYFKAYERFPQARCLLNWVADNPPEEIRFAHVLPARDCPCSVIYR